MTDPIKIKMYVDPELKQGRDLLKELADDFWERLPALTGIPAEFFQKDKPMESGTAAAMIQRQRLI